MKAKKAQSIAQELEREAANEDAARERKKVRAVKCSVCRSVVRIHTARRSQSTAPFSNHRISPFLSQNVSVGRRQEEEEGRGPAAAAVGQEGPGLGIAGHGGGHGGGGRRGRGRHAGPDGPAAGQEGGQMNARGPRCGWGIERGSERFSHPERLYALSKTNSQLTKKKKSETTRSCCGFVRLYWDLGKGPRLTHLLLYLGSLQNSHQVAQRTPHHSATKQHQPSFPLISSP